MCLQWVSASTVTLLSHFLFIYLSTTHIETLYSIQVLKVRLFSCWSLSFLFLSPMTAFNKKCSYWQFKSLCNTGDITSFPEVCEYSLMGKDFRLRDLIFFFMFCLSSWIISSILFLFSFSSIKWVAFSKPFHHWLQQLSFEILIVCHIQTQNYGASSFLDQSSLQ